MAGMGRQVDDCLYSLFTSDTVTISVESVLVWTHHPYRAIHVCGPVA